ncbi:hypothetical protein AXF42_Ash001089 [Apostasia shenzhenica]|uniref:Uncharacterized protein n=1 Tax=Apostasia shenzhenica TaxID=1088818 RepID=A0A2I0AU06_9ASPA|nr:hypothetical protein AXF42_Ash001089 [Apostasia shenzhenica]
MEGARRKAVEFFGKWDNLTSLFLAGSFVALSWRSSVQQREIDALEAEKSALQSGNRAMSSAVWEWHQYLFHLAKVDPSTAPIPLARLRAIYGEDDLFAGDNHRGMSQMHIQTPSQRIIHDCLVV